MNTKTITVLVLMVVLVLLALIIAQSRSKAPLILGGLAAMHARKTTAADEGRETQPFALSPAQPVEIAIEELSREIDPEKTPPKLGGNDRQVVPHQPHKLTPLDAAMLQYLDEAGEIAAPPPMTTGGAPSPPKAKKPWRDHDTWDSFGEDAGAWNEYTLEWAATRDNPNQDWSGVLAKLTPHLDENREYIGHIDLGKDGKTLEIVAMDASPTIMGEFADESHKGIYGAEVPIHLVTKYYDKPALYVFHTHPNGGHPYPSPPDISGAIHLEALSRFAGYVVISKYGAMVARMSNPLILKQREAKNFHLAVEHFSHDFCAALMSVRSWAPWNMAEYEAIYPKYQMQLLVYPTPQYTSDYWRYTYASNQESRVDNAMLHHSWNRSKELQELIDKEAEKSTKLKKADKKK
ncbi:MAG: hypothetical protein WC052_04525 [Patescibacteria group bacterium]